MKKGKAISLLMGIVMAVSSVVAYAENVSGMVEYKDNEGNVYKISVSDGKTYKVKEIVMNDNSDTITFPETVEGLPFGGMGTTYSNEKNLIPTTVKHINFPESIPEGTIISIRNANAETVKLPQNITKLSNDMFFNWENLKNIEIPETVTEIGNSCFFGCSSLMEITIPQGVKYIDQYAFRDCTSLKTINWNYTAQLGNYDVFDGTPYLANQPGGLLLLENGTKLYRCDENVKTAEIPEGVTEIAALAFKDTNVEKVICPKSLTRVGERAFADMPRLVDVEFNGEVKEYGNEAFSGCESLQKAIIPTTITEIPMNCFYACKNLTSVIVPYNVTYIGKNAFDSCDNLSYFEVQGPAKIEGYYYISKLKMNNIKLHSGASYLPILTEPKNSKDSFWFLWDEVDGKEITRGTPNPIPTVMPTATPTATAVATEKPDATQTPTAVPTATEEPQESINVAIKGGEIEITSNNEKVEFPDEKPFVDESERTQIPIRALAEMLNFDVDWDGENLSAILKKGDTTITIKIGSNEIRKNQEKILMDTTAKVINDRTYIPLRYISEALGYKVAWLN